MPRLIPLFALVACLVAACGSSNKTAVSVGPKLYKDKQMHFQFRYPANWKTPKPQPPPPNDPNSYIVAVNGPAGTAQIEVTVDSSPANFPPFPEGKVSPVPGGGGFFHYHHVRVAGRPAVRVERWAKDQIDEIDTFVNTTNSGYNIRMLTGTPPFNQKTLGAYALVLKTLRIPFS